MDFNKLAQEIYLNSYRDEMAKMAQEKKNDSYIPAIAAAAALPFLASQGSILGRKAGLASMPLIDWSLATRKPAMGLGDYLTGTIGARGKVPHIGTLAGALAGVGGAALLYDLLKDYY